MSTSDQHAPTLCIYHSPCLDGFAAAWVIRTFHPNVVFERGVYGQPPPAIESAHHLLLVDFSYKRPIMEELAYRCASVTVLDHHASARDELTPLLEKHVIGGQFDMGRSGAMMAWDWSSVADPPRLIRHIQDYDLWRFQHDDTRPVIANLGGYEYDFDVWSQLIADFEIEGWRAQFIREGVAIERKVSRDVRQVLYRTARMMVIGGHRVPVANLPHMMTSEGAGFLAENGLFGGSYYDDLDGRRVFSLRSRKDGHIDVAKIAESYGGGGHQHAAGFTMPRGWEGDLA